MGETAKLYCWEGRTARLRELRHAVERRSCRITYGLFIHLTQAAGSCCHWPKITDYRRKCPSTAYFIRPNAANQIAPLLTRRQGVHLINADPPLEWNGQGSRQGWLSQVDIAVAVIGTVGSNLAIKCGPG